MSTNSSAVARTKLLLKRPNRGRLHQSGKPITADQLLTSYATNVGIGLELVGGHLAPRSVPGGVSTPQKLPSGL